MPSIFRLKSLGDATMSDGHRSATDLEGTVSGEPLAVRMTSMADLMLRRAEPHRLCLSTSDLKSMRTLSINGEEERRSTLQLLNRHWISSAALADSLRESRAAGQPVFVLDCRSAVDFGKCHIVDAINVSLPSILYKRLLKGSLHPSAVVSAKETREKFLAAYRTALIVLISHADKQQSSRNRADSLDSVLDTPSVPFVPHDNSISPLPHLCLASFSGLSASVGPLPGGSQCDQDVGGNPVGGDVAMLICNRLVEEKCEVAVLSDDFQLFAEQNEDLVVGYRNPKKTAADTFLTSNGVPHSREESLSSPLDLTHLQLSSEAAEETSDQQTIAAGCQGSEDSSYSSSLSSSGRSSDSGTPTEEKKAKLTPPRANGQRTATPLAAVPLRHHHCPPLVAVDPTSFSSEVEAVGDDYEKPSGSHPTSNFPVEIIPYLFLGNALNSADLETLERYGIRYILNVTPNLPNVFEQNKLFKYFQIPITDHWSQNIAQYFQAAIDFIDEGRHQQCGVLVHCLAGISRSVTIVVAYLMMRHRSMTLDAAYDLVKAQKPNISPNFNFMGQLLDWQTQLQTGVAASPKRCQCGSDETGGGCVVCSTNGKTQRHFISSPIALRSDGGAEL